MFASNFEHPTDRSYARATGTETTRALEELVGGLEGGHALAFGSGMGAAAAVFADLPVGSRIAVPDTPYHGVGMLVDQGEAQGRWSATRLDLADTDAWIDALDDHDLIWLESPSNPLMTVADLAAICGAERPAGAVVAVDSTFATPICQQPLALGADIVMHSATKFLGGHSDLLAGVLITNSDEHHERLATVRTLHGASIGAIEAFLTIRGIRTLELRMERAQHNAAILAERLQSHGSVANVRWPGLAEHPTHAAAARFMTGFGAMMSFEVLDTAEQATAFCEGARIIRNATSLGGVESTMERRAGVAGQETMPPTLIRFSVGCEDVEDLWTDLDQALANAGT